MMRESLMLGLRLLTLCIGGKIISVRESRSRAVHPYAERAAFVQITTSYNDPCRDEGDTIKRRLAKSSPVPV